MTIEYSEYQDSYYPPTNKSKIKRKERKKSLSNTTQICVNCSTTSTPLWRRDEQGESICNACGLYYKLHGTHRPCSLKKPTLTRRSRKRSVDSLLERSDSYYSPDDVNVNGIKIEKREENMIASCLSTMRYSDSVSSHSFVYTPSVPKMEESTSCLSSLLSIPPNPPNYGFLHPHHHLQHPPLNSQKRLPPIQHLFVENELDPLMTLASVSCALEYQVI